MLNRDIYQLDPTETQLANNGVAVVNDDNSQAALTTLEFELKTFVCDGKYAKGLESILDAFIRNNRASAEQPAVWISGFFGSGKSHLAKMLRTLWINQSFSGGNDARGLADLPEHIHSALEALSTIGASSVGLHSASGTLKSGANDNVRLTLLGILFKSVGLPEKYHLARFVLWLKREGVFEDVHRYVSENSKKGKEKGWVAELQSLFMSPIIHQAIVNYVPDIASERKEVAAMLRAQFQVVKDVSNDEMVDALVDALAVNGELPLTLVVLDEVQQYIGTDLDKAIMVQEVVETCCKDSRLKSKVLFVATGQSALSGMSHLQLLMGRFQVRVQLEDTDVDAVIRKVILQKKETARNSIEAVIKANLGEISRHLHGSTIEHNKDDEAFIVTDYPLLPTRRRFWETVLHSLDKTGTGSQLRNQLKIVHEACRESADKTLGHVVPADFIYNQISTDLLQTAVISKDIYETIGRLSAGDASSKLQSRILSLILLISKLPAEANFGIIATADSLADLLIEDLNGDKNKLRVDIPVQLDELEQSGQIMSMQTAAGKEYRLQTAESGLWYDMFRQQEAELRGNPQRIETFRAQMVQQFVRQQVAQARLLQGESTVMRPVVSCFDEELPKDACEKIYAWAPNLTEKAFLDEARGAGTEDPSIFIYVPTTHRTELQNAIIAQKAAETTIAKRGIATTEAGKEARSAMEHRFAEANRNVDAILKELFSNIQVKQAGGSDVEGDNLTERVLKAGQTSIIRLYPDFKAADDKKWEKVYDKARKEGGENALEALGFNEETAKHPVCELIKRYIGISKKGVEIKDNFLSSPFGWSQDAVEGALFAMLAAGVLKATDSQGNAVDAKNLDRKQVNQTDFKPETVTINTMQLVKVRGMINALGVSCTSGEEQSKLSQAIQNAKAAAQKCGGPAPLPMSPSTQVLDALLLINGNAQLQQAFDNKSQIESDYANWSSQVDLVYRRNNQWKELEYVLAQCRDLHIYSEISTQQQAIITNRSLLAEPNPIETLIKTAITGLRDCIVSYHGKFEKEFHAGMEELENDTSWQKLSDTRKTAILKEHGIDKLPELNLGSKDAVLDSLTECGFKQWSDKTSALMGRFDAAIKQAVKELEPKIQQVRISKNIIKSEQDLTDWLAKVEQEVKAKLAQGPVSPY
jgi:hypothetical protein